LPLSHGQLKNYKQYDIGISEFITSFHEQQMEVPTKYIIPCYGNI